MCLSYLYNYLGCCSGEMRKLLKKEKKIICNLTLKNNNNCIVFFVAFQPVVIVADVVFCEMVPLYI